MVTEHLNVASVTKELSFSFYLILVSLNSHIRWLVATLLVSVTLFLTACCQAHYQEPKFCTFSDPYGIICSSVDSGSGGGLATMSSLTPVTSWTIACQAPLSMGFPRQE